MRSVFSFIVLLSAFVAAEDSDSWSGCVNPATGSKESIEIGSKHTVCFTVGPGGSWSEGATYLRYTFRPMADEYSRFHIPDSFNDLVRDSASPLDGNLTVHVAAQDFLSFLRVYYDRAEGRVYPFLTAIIDVDQGKVRGIAWDDACVFCNKKRCLENMFDFNGRSASELGIKQPSKGCYITAEECSSNTEENDCDLTLYVVWTGTDKNGAVFQSSPNRFSAFPPRRLQDRLLNNVPDLPDLPKLPDVPSIPGT